MYDSVTAQITQPRYWILLFLKLWHNTRDGGTIFLDHLKLEDGPVIERQSLPVEPIPRLGSKAETQRCRDEPLVASSAVDVEVMHLAGTPVRHIDVGISPRTPVAEEINRGIRSFPYERTNYSVYE